MMSAWLQFIRERFPLGSHVPMVACFTLGNFALAARFAGVSFEPTLYAAGFVIALLLFFRLRCFDEIKDYAVDVAVNPTRPLARGLLKVSQVKRMIYAVTALELVLTGVIGKQALATHLVAVAYSFLMYREFFIGKHLRPHLTTYAVTHTFVSMLLGWSIAAIATGRSYGDFNAALWLVGPINWMLFNLFEFARKTFAPEEERANVESYSSLFGPVGAAALSLSQICVTLALIDRLWQGSFQSLSGLGGHLLLALLPLAGALYFVLKRRETAAKVFRGFTSAYLILFYILLAWQGLG